MAVSTVVSKRIKRKAPRAFLRRTFKQKKPHLRLETACDLLIHLNCLLFVHRLAEESRTNACENKSRVIKKDHVLTAAKSLHPVDDGIRSRYPQLNAELNSWNPVAEKSSLEFLLISDSGQMDGTRRNHPE